MSASAAAEFYDEAYDDARPEGGDRALAGIGGARSWTPRRADGPAGDGSGAVGRSERGPVTRAGGGVAELSERGVVGRAAGLRAVRDAGLGDLVRPASEHVAGAVGSTRILPVLSGLRALLPGGGLRRGATIAVHTSSVLLALLAAASRAGSWCAVVGLPTLSPIAAAEMGIALERLALVPNPGTEWTTIVAALLDGVDIVVAAPPGPVAPVVAGRLAARARQRGSVLMPAGPWAGADLTIAPVHGAWSGLGAGRGRLRCREMTIQARGRGAAAAPREVTLWLPAIEGVLPPVTRTLRPAAPEPAPAIRILPSAARAAALAAAVDGSPAEAADAKPAVVVGLPAAAAVDGTAAAGDRAAVSGDGMAGAAGGTPAGIGARAGGGGLRRVG